MSGTTLGFVVAMVGQFARTKIDDRIKVLQKLVLSDVQVSKLMGVLPQLENTSVYLMGIQGDRDSVRLANRLKEAFIGVGWQVDGVWEDGLIGGAGTGVLVRKSPTQNDSVGQQIVDALNAINLQARLVEKSDIADNRLEIIVGAKP